MCLNPRYIRNRNRLFKPGVDVPVIRVKCGRCQSCQESRSDDLLVRAYYDYKSFSNRYPNNSLFFLTLTYNPENIPYFINDDIFHFEDGNIVYPRFCCPDFSDVQKFLKLLRRDLKKFFMEKVSLRYLCTVEYGSKGKKGSDGVFHEPKGRVHYHMILYFSKFMNENVFFSMAEKAWCRYTLKRNDKGRLEVDKRYSRGFIRNIRLRMDNTFREQRNCFKYVCKYVTKSDFRLPGSASSRIRLSLGFGANADFSEADLKRGFIFLPLGKDNSMKKFLIPNYYYLRLKIPYLSDENARYVDKSFDNIVLDYIHEHEHLFDVIGYKENKLVHSDYSKEISEFRIRSIASQYVENMSICSVFNWTQEQKDDIFKHLLYNVDDFSRDFSQFDPDDLISYFTDVRPFIWRYSATSSNLSFPESFWARVFRRSHSLIYDDVERLFIVYDYLLDFRRLNSYNLSIVREENKSQFQPYYQFLKYGRKTDCSESKHRVLLRSS